MRARSGVGGNRISPLPNPMASGVQQGGEPQTKEGQEVFNQAALQDSDFIPDGIGMKNQNNKTEINRQQPGGVQTP